MGMIIKNGVEYNFGSSNTDSSSMEIITQAEYDALVANGTMDNDKYYFITDTSVSKNATASDIPYDNTESGMSATDVQGAVDEVSGDVAELNQNLGNIYRSDIQNATSLENALSIICDKSTDKYKAYSGVMYIPYSIEPERNGWYSYRFNNIDNTVWYGIITGNTDYTFSRSAGADAVLKKLGKTPMIIPKIEIYSRNANANFESTFTFKNEGWETLSFESYIANSSYAYDETSYIKGDNTTLWTNPKSTTGAGATFDIRNYSTITIYLSSYGSGQDVALNNVVFA